jgi:hypothetical protein
MNASVVLVVAVLAAVGCLGLILVARASGQERESARLARQRDLVAPVRSAGEAQGGSAPPDTGLARGEAEAGLTEIEQYAAFAEYQPIFFEQQVRR